MEIKDYVGQNVLRHTLESCKVPAVEWERESVVFTPELCGLDGRQKDSGREIRPRDSHRRVLADLSDRTHSSASNVVGSAPRGVR